MLKVLILFIHVHYIQTLNQLGHQLFHLHLFQLLFGSQGQIWILNQKVILYLHGSEDFFVEVMHYFLVQGSKLISS